MFTQKILITTTMTKTITITTITTIYQSIINSKLLLCYKFIGFIKGERKKKKQGK